jgi:hypothetical protein
MNASTRTRDAFVDARAATRGMPSTPNSGPRQSVNGDCESDSLQAGASNGAGLFAWRSIWSRAFSRAFRTTRGCMVWPPAEYAGKDRMTPAK